MGKLFGLKLWAKDESSDISVKANEMYLSLEEQFQININDTIEVCTQYFFDLIINFLEEYLDLDWVNQNDKLTAFFISATTQ